MLVSKPMLVAETYHCGEGAAIRLALAIEKPPLTTAKSTLGYAND